MTSGPGGGPDSGSRHWRWKAYRLLLVAGVLAGLKLAWDSGFDMDDVIERITLEQNLSAVERLVSGDEKPFAELERHGDRYYGVGFHVVSLPVQWALAPLFRYYQGVSGRPAMTLAEQFASLLFFLFGCWCFHRTLRLAGAGREVALLGTILLLLNPYLVGHAAMNTKDAPFMAAWLACTWRLMVPAANLLDSGGLRWRDFAWLGVATGFLLSIRLSGALVVVQYAVVLAAVVLLARDRVAPVAAKLAGGVALSAAVAAALVYALYPVFWPDPTRIVEAFAYMAAHPWNSCTLTWGSCLPARELPWYYVPAWGLVKVPVAVLGGFVAAAVLLMRGQGVSPVSRVALAAFVATPVAVVALLAALGSTLYNELRQVLFLVPLLYLAAILALDRVPRVARVLLLATIGVQVVDQVTLHPYQYIWFNEAARFSDLSADFETDYWDLSSRELAPLAAHAAAERDACLYVSFPHQYGPYIGAARPRCLDTSAEMRGTEPRPLLFAVVRHMGMKGYWDAPNCPTLYEVQRRLLPNPAPIALTALKLCEK